MSLAVVEAVRSIPGYEVRAPSLSFDFLWGPEVRGYHLECAALTGARSAGSECLANTLAFTVVL